MPHSRSGAAPSHGTVTGAPPRFCNDGCVAVVLSPPYWRVEPMGLQMSIIYQFKKYLKAANVVWSWRMESNGFGKNCVGIRKQSVFTHSSVWAKCSTHKLASCWEKAKLSENF
ncbi:hypothetical protein U9M48_034087 [Paspalum notatum var. saurae]|uniref:Uncharacterized protein n=1 Tax=Paspalum notatum var. saurae TaxID=547442 RepID=A0AAQ3U8Y5_PASNO